MNLLSSPSSSRFCSLFLLIFLCLGSEPEPVSASLSNPAWGIDSRTAGIADNPLAQAYLSPCLNAGVHWFRESLSPADDPEITRKRLRRITRSGGKIIAIYPWRDAQEFSPVSGNLETNLFKIYQQARTRSRAYQGVISVWEMANEPDLGFVRAMPDQYAAWAKAVYLGLKSGSPNPPRVLIGGMGLPSGPYLNRAAENGLLYYTDAYNQHYYGHPEQFAPMIRKLRADLKSLHLQGKSPMEDFPVWVTECGFRTALNRAPHATASLRSRQAKSIAAYAQAAIQSRIAAFFIYDLYAHSPFSLFESSPSKPFPAWNQYRTITRSHPTENPLLFAKKTSPTPSLSPIIIQWRPEISRVSPVKVSGAYQFRPDSFEGQRSMEGTLRLYNVSDQPVHGFFSWNPLKHTRLTFRGKTGQLWLKNALSSTLPIAIPALSHVDLDALFITNTNLPFRDSFSASFSEHPINQRGSATTHAQPPLSQISFSLENSRDPTAYDSQSLTGSLPFSLPGRIRAWLRSEPSTNPDFYHFHYIDRPGQYTVTSARGPWLGINGVTVSPPWHTSPPSPVSHREYRLDMPWIFTLTRNMTLPNQPPMAITRVNGLPKRGILLLHPDRFIEKGYVVRVDLVDKDGRRFNIYEHFAIPYDQTRHISSLWLNIEDFHPYCWGNFSDSPFRPENVREIQLRLYAPKIHQPFSFRLEFLSPHLE